MICPDCATGADAARMANIPGVTPGLATQAATIAQARHDQCRQRNAGREYGQLPDCTCQHAERTTP